MTTFWIVAPLIVVASLGLLFARKAVHAALSMALVMVSLGIFYVAQHAEFVGIIQIFVYSGAVMMLFLFVVMLIGVDSSDSLVETLPGQRIWGWLLALGFVGLAALAVSRVTFPAPVGLEQVQAEGAVTGLAREIFERQVFGFEMLAALLVIAVMGAMVLAHREQLTPRITQREMANERIRSGKWLAGKPAPGVYARHNAADTPALLPDGTPVEESVPRVLVARDQVSPPQPYRRVSDAAYDAIEGQDADEESEVERTSKARPGEIEEGSRR